MTLEINSFLLGVFIGILLAMLGQMLLKTYEE